MKFQPASRMDSFHLSVFTQLQNEKDEWQSRTGKPVLDFSLGSPDIPPAPNVMETLEQAAGQAKNYKYAVRMIPELRSAIQQWYKERYNFVLEDDEIALLQGSQEALVNLPLLYCNPGDGVLVPDPYYPVYVDAPRLAQAEVLFMPLKKENDWLIDLDAISEEQRKKAKMMIVCYPDNPTGAVCPDGFIEKLITFARENDILIVYDSAYSDLVFEGTPGRSFLSFEGAKEVGVEINSFSKSYGMAGARLGVLLGNSEVIAQYNILKSNMDYGVFLPVQYAGIEALKTGSAIVEETRAIYQRRRALIQKEFTQAGWQLELPAATMFIWAPIPQSYSSSTDFCKDLLRETGILVSPGSSFGPAGEGYVRLALVCDDSQILEAARRLQQTHFFKK